MANKVVLFFSPADVIPPLSLRRVLRREYLSWPAHLPSSALAQRNGWQDQAAPVRVGAVRLRGAGVLRPAGCWAGDVPFTVQGESFCRGGFHFSENWMCRIITELLFWYLNVFKSVSQHDMRLNENDLLKKHLKRCCNWCFCLYCSSCWRVMRWGPIQLELKWSPSPEPCFVLLNP